MKKLEYLDQIVSAETATRLHALGHQANNDPELIRAHCLDIHAAISDRFGALNFAAAKPVTKGRWD